jgi:hypothetical protein
MKPAMRCHRKGRVFFIVVLWYSKKVLPGNGTVSAFHNREPLREVMLCLSNASSAVSAAAILGWSTQ